MADEIPVDALLANWGLWASYDECRDVGSVYDPEDGMYYCEDRGAAYGFPDATREADERLALELEPIMVAMLTYRPVIYWAAWEFYVRRSTALSAAGHLRCSVEDYYDRLDAARSYVRIAAGRVDMLRHMRLTSARKGAPEGKRPYRLGASLAAET